MGGTAIVMGVEHRRHLSRVSTCGATATASPRSRRPTSPPPTPTSRARSPRSFSLSAAVNEGWPHRTRRSTSRGFLTYRPFNKSDEKWKFKIRDAEPHEDEADGLREHHRRLIEHRHRADHRAARTLRFGKLPARVRLRLDDRPRTSRRERRHHEACGRLAGAPRRSRPRYGYGYAATSLQLAAAVNTIANGGVYVAPRLVLSTIDANGRTHNGADSPSHEVVTPQTAATMNR